MKNRVSSEQFYTAGIGSLFILFIFVFGIIFIYDKMKKKEIESSYKEKERRMKGYWNESSISCASGWVPCSSIGLPGRCCSFWGSGTRLNSQ